MRINRLDMLDCVTEQIRARGLRTAFDANETAVFARELEHIQAGVVEKKFPALVGVLLVPIVGAGIIPGARSHTYREIDTWGEAEILEEFSLDDFPSAEVRGAEQSGKFRSFGAKYSYTFEELRARPSLSWDPISKKGETARRVMEEKLDKLILGTATGTNGPFKGLIHDDNSQNDTTTAGTPDFETGVEATDVATIIKTFRTMVAEARKATKGVYNDFDFVVSLAVSIKLNLFVPSTTVGGGTTVASFLLQHVQGVRSISVCPRLDGAGASGKDRILCFPRDPEVLDCLVPIRFEQFAPQLNGMAFVTPCHGKFGGLRIYQPLAIRRCDVTVT
jgi:hypothetical protein